MTDRIVLTATFDDEAGATEAVSRLQDEVVGGADIRVRRPEADPQRARSEGTLDRQLPGPVEVEVTVDDETAANEVESLLSDAAAVSDVSRASSS